MKEYHKIQSIFKRDKKTNHIIVGDFSLPEFEFLANCKWQWTEKVDGMNMRIMFNGQGIRFGGKTDNAMIPADLIARLNGIFLEKTNLLQEMFGTEEKDGTPLQVCLYGEGYGAGIQKGGNYRKDKDFVLFDVKIGEWFLERKNVEDIAQKLGLDIVPIIGYGSIAEAIELVANGMPSKWGDFIAEGLVLRPTAELKNRRGERIITKIKHKDFQELINEKTPDDKSFESNSVEGV